MMDAACKDSGFPGRYFDKNGIMEFFIAEEGLPPRKSRHLSLHGCDANRKPVFFMNESGLDAECGQPERVQRQFWCPCEV